MVKDQLEHSRPIRAGSLDRKKAMIELLAICVLILVGLSGYTIGLAAAPKPSSPPPQRHPEV